MGEEQFSPRGRLYVLQVMDYIEDDWELAKEFRRILFQCALCGRCEKTCQSGVSLLEVWHKYRAQAIASAKEELGYLHSLRESLASVGNI